MRSQRIFGAIVLLSTLAFPEFQAGIDMGYGFSAGGDLMTTTNEETQWDNGGTLVWSTTMREHGYVSGGNGLKLGIEAAYFLNGNFGVMFATGYSFAGGWEVEDIQKFLGGPTVTQTTDVSASVVPLNFGVKFKTDLWGLSPYIFVAPGIYFPSMEADVSSTDPNSEGHKITSSFDMGLGFSSGMGVMMKKSEMITLKAEINANYAYADVNKTEDLNVVSGHQHTTIYKNDASDQDLAVQTAATSEQAGQPQISFSSIALKIGVVISF